MARRGIKREQVVAAAERVAARREPVTVKAVREELGNTGSYSTISTYLKTWRNCGDTPEDGLPRAVERDAVGLAGSVWQGLVQMVERLVRDRGERTEHHLQEVESEVHDSESALRALTARCGRQEQAVAELERRLEAREGEIRRLTAELEALRERLDGVSAGRKGR